MASPPDRSGRPCRDSCKERSFAPGVRGRGNPPPSRHPVASLIGRLPQRLTSRAHGRRFFPCGRTKRSRPGPIIVRGPHVRGEGKRIRKRSEGRSRATGLPQKEGFSGCRRHDSTTGGRPCLSPRPSSHRTCRVHYRLTPFGARPGTSRPIPSCAWRVPRPLPAPARRMWDFETD